MAKRLKEEIGLWAVRIESTPPCFAHGAIGKYLSHSRRQASAYCKELAKHVEAKCKVVKVVVTIAE